MVVQAAVFQLKPQHWRLGDGTWRLVYLLQKANDTAASLMPQIPRLVQRRTPTRSPEGSVRPQVAGSGSAEAAGTINTGFSMSSLQCEKCMLGAALHERVLACKLVD